MNTFPIIPASKISLTKRKLVFGIGINDADYMIRPRLNGKGVMCPFYQKWHNMLGRCYNPKYHEKQPTYLECSVCEPWLTFSNFRAWMVKQDWRGKHLDKDLLILGNKTYSPETCIFVPGDINKLINDHAAKRGKWPIGVCFDKASGRFRARCRVNGGYRDLGRFSTPEQAHKAYVIFKEEHIHQIALEQEEPLKAALLNWTFDKDQEPICG